MFRKEKLPKNEKTYLIRMEKKAIMRVFCEVGGIKLKQCYKNIVL